VVPLDGITADFSKRNRRTSPILSLCRAVPDCQLITPGLDYDSKGMLLATKMKTESIIVTTSRFAAAVHLTNGERKLGTYALAFAIVIGLVFIATSSASA
jgi:hypothetical protein